MRVKTVLREFLLNRVKFAQVEEKAILRDWRDMRSLMRPPKEILLEKSPSAGLAFY
jgi:hypothetical protein